MKTWQVLFFVVLLWPLIGMQHLSHPIVTHILRAELLEFLANFVRAMRDSDLGVRIVCVHGHNSDFHSIFTVQETGCNFQYGTNFGVSSDPTLLVVMLLPILAKCKQAWSHQFDLLQPV